MAMKCRRSVSISRKIVVLSSEMDKTTKRGNTIGGGVVGAAAKVRKKEAAKAQKAAQREARKTKLKKHLKKKATKNHKGAGSR